MRNAFLPPPRHLPNQPSAPSSLQIQSPVPSNAVRTHAVTQKPTSPTTTPPHLHPPHYTSRTTESPKSTEQKATTRHDLRAHKGRLTSSSERDATTKRWPSHHSLSLSYTNQPFEDLPAEAPRPSFFFFFSSTTRRPTLALTACCFLNAHSYYYNYNNILPAACLRV